MSWTINNQSPESLSLTIANITLNAETASEATLSVAADSYTDNTSFTYGQRVTLKYNGSTVFSGTVFQTPRAADGSSESYDYILKDAWYEMERLVYQVEREYVKTITPPESGDDEDATIDFVTKYVGTTTFETADTLGDRIETLVEYADIKGANVSVGNISNGVNWYRTESKDRTCAEMIREMLQLMPDHVAWIDTSKGTPQFNMVKRTSLPSRTYTLGQDAITSHTITSHESENAPCVAIRYEKPITVDSENYTEITEDIAPDNADPTQIGTIVETVGLQGGVFQNEYARVTTDTIPQDDAGTDDIKEWWIRYTPALAAVAEEQGLDKLLAVVDIPNKDDLDEDIKKHKITIVDDGIDRPDPINPNATPIAQTTIPEDYPRHIIEGSLPEWAGMRYRQVSAEVTMAVLVSEYEAIQDEELKAALGAIFNVPKTFDSKDYLTAGLNGVVMGTNARTKNYKRAVTSDPGEEPPTGIASQVLAELNKTRYSGSIEVVGQDPDTITIVGQRLRISGGRGEWYAMDEAIQSVSHDVQAGTTVVSFGPPQNLGANDLIDRLRASRVNQYGFGVQSGQEIEEGIGGNAANPVFNFTVQNGGGTESIHPWTVNLTVGDSGTTAKIVKGKIYDGLLSVTEITPTIEDDFSVSADDLICLEYTVATEAIKSIVVAEADYEPFTDDGEDPPVVETVVQPIAKIIDDNGTLKVEQIARNNFAVVDMCYKDADDISTPLKYLMAL